MAENREVWVQRYAEVLRQHDPELYKLFKDRLDDPMMRTAVRMMLQQRAIQKKAKIARESNLRIQANRRGS